MAESTLTRAKYAGLDFDTHSDDLRAQLQIKFASDYNDFVISSTGIMLLDLTAFGLSTLSFYLDRRATDSYLDTARTRKSVSRLTRQIGYKMGGAVASGVDLVVTIATPISVPVPIHARFQFKGPDDLIFEVAQEVTWTPLEQTNGVQKTVRCYEGETVIEQFVSDGSPNQIFELRRVPDLKHVVDGSVRIVVDGVEFSEVDLLEYGKTDQFEVGYSDDPPTIRFGDGVSGNIPGIDASIDVTYVASRGREGQVGKETIDDVISPLVVNFNTIDMEIINPGASVGGDYPESLSKAKAFAPKVFKSRYRAITEEDYNALAGSYADPLFGRVAVARAISARSAEQDLELKNRLNDITGAVAQFHPMITAHTAAASSSIAAQGVQLTNIVTAAGDADAELVTIDGQFDAVITAIRTITTNNSESSVDVGSITGAVVGGKAALDGLLGATLTATEVDQIKAFFDTISARITEIGAAVAAVTAAAGTALSTASDGKVSTATTRALVAGMATAAGTAQTIASDITTSLGAIVVANASVLDAVNTAADAIFAHVDSYLSADCKANLVVVPILTLDAAGFYTAPSGGLVDSLQNYLDQRKDVTHTVSVTSGADFLVAAEIVIRVGVRRGVSEQATKTAAEAAVDGLLRNRNFGDPLYESSIETRLSSLTGVVFSNVTIVGPLGKLDGSGNLIILDSEVVTKGSVTISTEITSQ